MNTHHSLLLIALLTTGAQGASLSGSNTTTLEWGTVTNPTGDVVPVTEGAATLFPSAISFTGVDANEVITDVSVTLPFGTGHTFIADLEITLEFGGVVVLLLQNAGGNGDINGDITFAAGNPVIPNEATNNLISGTFDVSVVGVGRATTAPTPTGFALDAFDGVSPDGTWNLYLFDDSESDTGSFAGWSLNITTETVPEPSTVLLLAGAGLLVLRRRR